MRALAVVALIAPLLLVTFAAADAPPDGGVALLDAGIFRDGAPCDAANIDAARDGGATHDGAIGPIVPAPVTPAAPYTLLPATPQSSEAPARARPTPLYRSPLFWTSVIFGAGAIVAVAMGIGLAATYHSRYALLSF